MWRRHSSALAAVLALSVIGCGKSGVVEQVAASGDAAAQGDAANQTQEAEPAAAVHQFLEAVRTGNDERASAMLTPLARKKTTEMNLVVAPPGSDTAKFKVGQVQYIAADGARVATIWTDKDENSRERTDEMLWMVRKEPEGWRVAGVAATVFPGEPPLLLDFENPEQMLKQQKWAEEEARRRVEQPTAQVQGAEKSQNSVRR